MEGGGGVAPGKVCTFWRQGRCRFGDGCRYVHALETPIQTPIQDIASRAGAGAGASASAPSSELYGRNGNDLAGGGGGLESLEQGDFPSLEDSAAAALEDGAAAAGGGGSQGSMRLGKWSGDEGMQGQSLAVDVRPRQHHCLHGSHSKLLPPSRVDRSLLPSRVDKSLPQSMQMTDSSWWQFSCRGRCSPKFAATCRPVAC